MRRLINAMVELYLTLADAWAEADLRGRIEEWWWAVTGPEALA